MTAELGFLLRTKLTPLDAAPLRVRGDRDLNPDWDGQSKIKFRPAAVLAPIVMREEGWTLLFTQRTEDVPAHPGQISFPGGRAQPEDRDLLDTALRETEEEIGLERSLIEPIGALDHYATGTGFMITPIVGLVRPGFTLTLCEREVADVFEAPLAFFLDPANHQIGELIHNGVKRYLLRDAMARAQDLGRDGGDGPQSDRNLDRAAGVSTSIADAAWLKADETRAVMAALEAARPGASRFVGGCVRNTLMGRDVDDIDIATQLLPNDVIAAAKAKGLAAVPTGIEHGTITVICHHKPHEVTTLRRDVSTDGRRATVAFTQDWDEDAQRRDFRMNALYAGGDGASVRSDRRRSRRCTSRPRDVRRRSGHPAQRRLSAHSSFLSFQRLVWPGRVGCERACRLRAQRTRT